MMRANASAAAEVWIAQLGPGADEHLATRRLLRQALARRSSPDVGMHPISRGPTGKPFLPAGAPAISIAHAGGWCAIALCKDCPVGVDIEPLIDQPGLASVTGFLPARARVEIAATPSARKAQAVLRWWVRLEAAAKACDVPLDNAATCIDAVQLDDLHGDRFIAAVASRSQRPLHVTWNVSGR